MPKAVDAAIGRIEAAESLDQPAFALGRAISRTGQVAGSPSKRLANVLHGRGYGHDAAIAQCVVSGRRSARKRARRD